MCIGLRFCKITIATIKEIEKLCRSFLWANGEIVKGKAKVKWNDICRPKVYGGLGVKNLRKWNDALLAKHVWNVINKKILCGFNGCFPITLETGIFGIFCKKEYELDMEEVP